MTILYRYVTREILITFFIVLIAVMSIYVAVDFIEKIDNFMEAGVSAGRCLVHLAYKLPFIAVQIAPVGFLLSILIALGLMSKNNEIIALKSCGIGKRRILKPTLVIGLFLCGALFVTADRIVPVFMAKANQIWLQEVRKKNIYASKTNDIWMRSARQIIHISQYAPEEKRVSGITIHAFDDDFQLVRRVDAKSGEFIVKRVDAKTGEFINGNWQLNDVIQQTLEADSESYRVTVHQTLDAQIDLNPEDLAQAAKRSDEMGLAELRRYIEKVEREGYGATRYRVDYQSKIANPFVCIFLSVLGAGIALRGKLREGMAISITYGLGITFLYWVFNSLCLALGYAEMLPPIIAAWMGNLVFSCAAGVLVFSIN
ncbi:permease YjgP/YjgQ family protein [Desulfosarcina variabilis str. Montpellier]|uniref:LptF/LptG family permease n=1 Tax=Desulfosarcina variabilis TaxID=2300 RepID=UPI003AFB4D03